MCGIVGGVTDRNIVPILIEGLKRLEYRGYDSAGMAVLDDAGHLQRLRTVGKVRALEQALAQMPIVGRVGIAHTRWATHGVPSERNAHPHVSRDGLAIVHNGIIENYEELRENLKLAGYQFSSETDTEVVAHRVHFNLAKLRDLGKGDVAEVQRGGVRVIDREGNTADRPIMESELTADAAEKGPYRHFMLKEIHEQPRAVGNTLQERVANGRLLEAAFGPAATAVFERVEAVHIVACGTSYHAGVVASYLIEQICRMPCRVEIASEYRYRNPVVPKNSLFVSISQSGETADTLAALRMAARNGHLSSPSICNSPESSLVRESELVMLTRAGPEIGVASTKEFTTQLTALSMLAIALARHNGSDPERERTLIQRLIELPSLLEKTLELDPVIHRLALRFADRHHALSLGRGTMHAIAMEGALKLKEISYIHAEAYAAGELKHGPLALVDSDMPVVAVAPNNELLEKLKSNLMEVRARGGELYVFADPDSGVESSDGVHVIQMPKHVADFQAPIVYTIPLQLLAYHVAILKGTDVDQPRNLAKSVTVE